MATSVTPQIEDLLPELERLYGDIHAHPELSMQETRTTRIAADDLRGAGYEVTEGVGQTGEVGLLRNGDGPTVMLRADMDALPVQEQTGLMPKRSLSSPRYDADAGVIIANPSPNLSGRFSNARVSSIRGTPAATNRT